MNRCRGCGTEIRGMLCWRCSREFDPGDPDGPLAESDREGERARSFFKSEGGGETDSWVRDLDQ